MKIVGVAVGTGGSGRPPAVISELVEFSGAGAQRGGYVARASIDGLGASRVTPAALAARPKEPCSPCGVGVTGGNCPCCYSIPLPPPSFPTPSKARSRFA